MSVIVVLATLGAGVGLAAGLAFNLRLARALGMPLAATLVNFAVGASLLLALWFFGVDGVRPSALPPVWTLIGGLLGATYVTLSLLGAARLGVGVSTVAVTLGQVVGALIITGAGWLGQTPQRPTVTGLLSAVLLLGAVALLANDRQRANS
jgi:bacterial/archaeal transporter family-2 protein